MHQNVFILGATGSVAKELCEQISSKDGPSNNANPTNIIGYADSTHMHISAFPIQQISAHLAHFRQKIGRSIESRATWTSYTDMQEILQGLQKAGYGREAIIVDVTAAKGDKINSFHVSALENYGMKIVTANKNVVALGSQEVFNKVTATHGDYDYNTSVMAGAGVLDFIRSSRDVHDEVLSIEGCFSGTLGYIVSELEKGEKTFSDIVKEAKELGYTEPNPWDDLNGLDVARKLLILARTSGFNVNINDIYIAPLISSKEYEKLKGDDFLEAIKNEDDHFKNLYQTAKDEGKTYKYIAEFRRNRDESFWASVGLKKVDITSEIGSLKGTNNIAKIKTTSYQGEKAWTSIAPGAGLAITALSIRKAIAKMLPSGYPRFPSI